MKESKHVYEAIVKVQAELAKAGISKDRKNQAQGYQFRGIDDIYNTLAPLLADSCLCILPRLISRISSEKTSAKGGVLFYVVVEMEFDFVSALDGSSHTVKMAGEAMDSADKATNKAMSAAYKYACLQVFCIPTEGDNDADAHTPEVVAHKPAPPTSTYSKPRNEQPAIIQQNKDVDWAAFKYRYHLPVKAEGVDMMTARNWMKTNGFKFNGDDKHWYGNALIEKFEKYLRPLGISEEKQAKLVEENSPIMSVAMDDIDF